MVMPIPRKYWCESNRYALNDCLVAGFSFYLLEVKLKLVFALFPSVIAGLLLRRNSLIFLYIRHVAQMVRAFVRIVYHVRDAVSKMFKGLARCRRFESYRVDFQFPNFPKNKKEFPRGGVPVCHSADGHFYV